MTSHGDQVYCVYFAMSKVTKSLAHQCLSLGQWHPIQIWIRKKVIQIYRKAKDTHELMSFGVNLSSHGVVRIYLVSIILESSPSSGDMVKNWRLWSPSNWWIQKDGVSWKESFDSCERKLNWLWLRKFESVAALLLPV